MTASGVSLATSLELAARAGGACELCGRDLGATVEYSKHHRRPRGMGGSKRPETNGLTNLLLVCGSATTAGGCHQRIERHRAEALELGWLVLQSHDPAEVPVQIVGRGLVYLTPDGQYADGSP